MTNDSHYDDGSDALDDIATDPRLDRRSLLKATAVGMAGVAGGALGSAGAQSSDYLLVHDFEGDGYPGANAMGNWASANAFASQNVSNGVLRLEYDNAGFFASKVFRDVPYQYLVLGVRGDAGGEESDVQIEVGGTEAPLADVANGSIGTNFGAVAVDLVAMGVDRASVDDVRLNFWQGGSGAIELTSIAFTDDPSLAPGVSTPTPTPTDGTTPGGTDPTPTVEPDPFPWEATPGNEKEPSDVLPPSEITADTTLAELCPNFDDRENSHLYVPRSTTDYMPGSATDPGDVDITQTNLSDSEKAGLYDVNLSAVRDNIGDGSVTLGEMGTQTLGHVKTYLENGFPYHATAKLLGRLMFLPNETANHTYHKGGNPWDETAGPAAPVNQPGMLIQHEWPTDARTYVPDEKYERDRAHDQPDHQDGWTNGTPGEEVYADENHPLRTTIESGTHPITGADISGGFTSNAPMEARIKMHEQSGYLYQVLDFKNVQPVPFYIDTAIIWWVGPAGLSTLRNGHYNNVHRPGPGRGHPQRDIIEVIYDRERSLSAYAIRIAQHDEPYNMRTAYPNQWWGLEQGIPKSDPINGGSRFGSSEERQSVVDTMLNTLHIEIETNLDRNNELHAHLELFNRVSN